MQHDALALAAANGLTMFAACGALLQAGAVPAVIQDPAGHACLLVLPSDKPSNRKEAVAVEDLLAALLQVGCRCCA